MAVYSVVKVLHILSATVLFGTGLGTAFFMFRSHAMPDIQSKYNFAKTTVLADFIFTTPAVILQPITGLILIQMGGYEVFESWLLIAYGLFVLAGLCWLPVVWIQIQMKKILQACQETGDDLPERYHQLIRIWFVLGWPAFISLMVIFYLMVAKPT